MAISRITDEDLELTLVRRDEQGYAASAHLFAAVPIAGAVALFLLYYRFRQRSTEIIIHVQQAASFMVMIYLVWVAKLLVDVLLNVIRVIDASIADTIGSYNDSVLYAFYAIHVIFCLTGIIAVYLRRPFLYPIVGKYVMTGFLSRQRD